jgi:hypothetical protein
MLINPKIIPGEKPSPSTPLTLFILENYSNLRKFSAESGIVFNKKKG